MKALLLILAAIPIVIFLMNSRSHAGESLQPNELATLLKENIQLIDVRSPEEFAAGHIAGGKLIPLSQLATRISEIDKTKPVVFYCRSGRRSGTALDVVKDHGLMSPKHLAGGILAWTAAGLPTKK